MKLSAVIVALWAAALLTGCGGGSSDDSAVVTGSPAAETTAEEDWPIEPAGKLQGAKIEVKPIKPPFPKKLVVRDMKVGAGRKAETGDKVTIQFTAINFSGKPFESSWDFGHPFRFQLGNEEVSPGWEKGLPGMRVGGRRELRVPWTMISQTGIVAETGPDDGQVYVVELLAVS